MKAGGFDAVIGNPPGDGGLLRERTSLDHLRRRYARSASGKFDLTTQCRELGVRLTSATGFGMIVPNKFFHTGAAAHLRSLLAEKQLRHIIGLWRRAGLRWGDELLVNTGPPQGNRRRPELREVVGRAETSTVVTPCSCRLWC